MISGSLNSTMMAECTSLTTLETTQFMCLVTPPTRKTMMNCQRIADDA